MLIGDVVRRSGVKASALRFYEAEGLLGAARTAGGHRSYDRSVLRRLAFIRAAQAIGLDLRRIKAVFLSLPRERTPTAADWAGIAGEWQALVDARMAELMRLRTALTTCIGCGCLSLTACRLFNEGDRAGAGGAGARYLLGDPVPSPIAPRSK